MHPQCLITSPRQNRGGLQYLGSSSKIAPPHHADSRPRKSTDIHTPHPQRLAYPVVATHPTRGLVACSPSVLIISSVISPHFVCRFAATRQRLWGDDSSVVTGARGVQVAAALARAVQCTLSPAPAIWHQWPRCLAFVGLQLHLSVLIIPARST